LPIINVLIFRYVDEWKYIYVPDAIYKCIRNNKILIMKTLLLTLAILLSQACFGQKPDTSISKQLLKELADNACKCADSISLADKTKAEIANEINKCIDDRIMAYQLGVKLANLDALTKDAKEKDGKKQVNISIEMNKDADGYKEYYFEMERYLMDSCKAVKAKMATNDKQGKKSYSTNEEALALYSKGLDEAKKENCKKAISYYEQALKIDPEFAFAWDNMGICYRRLDNYDKALEAYQKSLEIDPEGLMPLQNIAIVYQYKREYSKAIEAYERLALIDKDNPEVYYGIGNIYTNFLQDYEKALPFMCKAYNLYIKQKSPYRADAEKIINIIYGEMKKQGKEARFSEILKENGIRTQ
jgi:tetratricopeptide (TPR) repeat protein